MEKSKSKKAKKGIKYSNGGKTKLYAIFLSCEHLDQIGKTSHKISVQSNPTCKMLIEIKMLL